MEQDNLSVAPYGEPVEETALRKGDFYFMVTYLDEAMLIPVVKTLAFLGKDVDRKSKGSLWFQDAESFTDRGAYPRNKKGKVDIYKCEKSGLSNIYELDKALKSLTRCLQRRTKNK
jgi:hypothetical protein